jgi:hypothetical protein
MAIKIFGKTIVGGEAQRKEAAANQMSGKYPLTNDCNLMKSTIEAAKAELAQINASRPSTAGGKRIKARNSDSLKVWINEMQNFLKDLTCGIVYTPEGIKITPVVATPPTAPSAPTFEPAYKPTVEPIAPIQERIVAPEPILPIRERGGLPPEINEKFPIIDQGPLRPAPVPAPTPAPIIYTKEVVEEYVQPSIRCADGTYDVANGVNPPCAKKGGIYMPSLPLPAPAPVLPSGQSTIVSSPLPATAVSGLPANVVAPKTDYASLYDTAALGTQIAQTNATVTPVAPIAKDDTQKYLMYGGIGLVGVLVLNSLLNRD